MESSTYFRDERKKKDGEEIEDPVIHYLPFKICQNGKANVGPRFIDAIRDNPDNSEVKETEFRSRPLKGSRVELPKNYKGLIVTSHSPSSQAKIKRENEKETLVIKEEFNSLVNWNWDKLPSSMDSIVKANDWLELAASLHESETSTE